MKLAINTSAVRIPTILEYFLFITPPFVNSLRFLQRTFGETRPFASGFIFGIPKWESIYFSIGSFKPPRKAAPPYPVIVHGCHALCPGARAVIQLPRQVLLPPRLRILSPPSFSNSKTGKVILLPSDYCITYVKTPTSIAAKKIYQLWISSYYVKLFCRSPEGR